MWQWYPDKIKEYQILAPAEAHGVVVAGWNHNKPRHDHHFSSPEIRSCECAQGALFQWFQTFQRLSYKWRRQWTNL